MAMQDPIRAFIAIELPPEVRSGLGAVQKQLQLHGGQPASRAVRWVAPGSIHLTLKFLGDVPGSKLEGLAAVLNGAAAGTEPFEILVAGLGAFPNPRRPRVVWVGCQAPAALTGLQKSIDQATRPLGFPGEERPFSPHLTLGRVGQNARPDEVAQLAGALAAVKIGELGRAPVTAIHLFQSDLRPGGPVYTSLYHFRLGSE